MNKSTPVEGGIPVPGVRGMDHTADIGLEIRAPDLPDLFGRAALATLWLVLGRTSADARSGEGGGGELIRKSVELAEEDLSCLLRSWLRTVLLWEDTEGFVISGTRLMLLPTPLCGAPDGQAFGLMGQVEGRFDDGSRVREIKGVTFHGLEVEESEGGWLGRVIFDV
jgi:SHS2 domain-containing protein